MDHTHGAQSADAATNASVKTPFEPQWPANVTDLPLYLTTPQLAKLLGKHVRSLERDRTTGQGVPYVKLGKRVLYPRDKTLAYLDSLMVSSTAEAKRSARAAPSSHGAQQPATPAKRGRKPSLDQADAA
jgi:hypothetical protein